MAVEPFVRPPDRMPPNGHRVDPSGYTAHDSTTPAVAERETDRPVTVILGPVLSARRGTWPSTQTVRSPHRNRTAWTGSPIHDQSSSSSSPPRANGPSIPATPST